MPGHIPSRGPWTGIPLRAAIFCPFAERIVDPSSNVDRRALMYDSGAPRPDTRHSVLTYN